MPAGVLPLDIPSPMQALPCAYAYTTEARSRQAFLHLQRQRWQHAQLQQRQAEALTPANSSMWCKGAGGTSSSDAAFNTYGACTGGKGGFGDADAGTGKRALGGALHGGGDTPTAPQGAAAWEDEDARCSSPLYRSPLQAITTMTKVSMYATAAVQHRASLGCVPRRVHSFSMQL